MHSPNLEFDLLRLRRQLEEILALVNADHSGGAFVPNAAEELAVPVHGNASIAEPEVARADGSNEPETCEPALLEGGQPDQGDDLYDDALIVLTEFGQASPAILQMWLSIDYARAIMILNRFQAEGLISPKGKVRHKAFSQRRSLEQRV